MDQVPQGAEWIHEIKLDGYRTLAEIKDKKVLLKTRSGLDWSDRYPSIEKELKKLKIQEAILDGEVVALDEQGHSSFAALQESLKKETDGLIYYVFDLLYLNGQDLRKESLEIRKQVLKKLIEPLSEDKIRFSAHVRAQGDELYERACKDGLEGIVSKNRMAPYRSGRHGEWLKIKCSKRQELIIGGYTDPQGSRESFGALLMGVYDKGKLRYVGRVGTGFGNGLLEELYEKFSKIETKESPFEISSPKDSSKIHWVKPKLVAEIEFSNWTQGQNLRHGVFQGLREDKKAMQVHIEKPKALKSLKSKVKAKPTKKTSSKFRITHPERVLYAKQKVTKLDVANYYRSIAPWILKHVSERPLSLVRCPSEAGGQCFFQKHMDVNQLDQLKEKQIKDQKTIFLNSEAGLLQLVQWGVLELHTWQCHAKKPLNPDQIVFDLDPAEGLSWKKVVTAAEQLRDLLDRLSLKSFLKTTGGKGLHLNVPIAPLYDWDQIKNFAKTVALRLAEENPGLYTTTTLKKKRTGKIFLDYLRNGFGATAIAPYSLRAKKDPFVSMPLDWSELKSIKGGNAFDIKSSLRRLAHQTKDPWEGYNSLKQKIKILS